MTIENYTTGERRDGEAQSVTHSIVTGETSKS
jgi:hypothetical protein